MYSCQTEPMNRYLAIALVGISLLGFSSRAQQPNPLAWTEWKQVATSTVKPTLTFSDVNISGFAGCNQFFGRYKLENSSLSFSGVGSTKKACQPNLMNLERDFLNSLSTIKSFKLSKDAKSLTLVGKGVRLGFNLTRATPNGFVQTARKVVNVYPEFSTCFDDAQKQCLLLEDLSDGTGWGKFTEPSIEGFNYEVGYRYQIQVAVETNPRTNGRRLRLLERIQQHWTKPAQPSLTQKILEIAPTLVDCEGFIKTQCMQVREPGKDWENFFGSIEGFSFKPDYSYKLLVNITKIENPPADSPNLKYTLVRLLDLDPVRR
jgi:heat shock protein HslJ